VATPWHDDDFVYFEAQTPEVVAFEPDDDGVAYKLPDFAPGVYRLPFDAIRPATATERRRRVPVVSVDACQIYLVDRSRVASFRDRFDIARAAGPNYTYLTALRREVGVDFGLAVVVEDGRYVIDAAAAERVPAGKVPARKKAADDPYLKVARRMRTFVCEVCFKEELMQPDDADAKELARLARAAGWLLAPPPAGRSSWFFEAFQVVGPRCGATAR
jgi:hypothetical protein